MSEIKTKLIEWSIGSVVGNISWGLIGSIGLFFFNERTGCIRIVLESMRGNEAELAAWSLAFTLFGTLIGLIIRHRIAINQLDDKDKEIKRVVEERTASFLDLQTRQLSAIFYCVARGGTVSIPSDSELARELQALKRMGYADTPDGSGQGSYWFVTDRTMNTIRNSAECSKLLDEAALNGRFDDEGRYSEVSQEVREYVEYQMNKEEK